MIAAILLLLLTGVIAFITAAVIGWQFILIGIAGWCIIKFIKRYILKS